MQNFPCSYHGFMIFTIPPPISYIPCQLLKLKPDGEIFTQNPSILKPLKTLNPIELYISETETGRKWLFFIHLTSQCYVYAHASGQLNAFLINSVLFAWGKCSLQFSMLHPGLAIFNICSDFFASGDW